MPRIYTRVGDIFEAEYSDEEVKYLQYIANDMSQLNSDVIRVFSRRYKKGKTPGLDEIVEGEVEFYAHCVVKWGIELGFWEKIGNHPEVGDLDILFRTTKGDRRAKISRNWKVWRINRKPWSEEILSEESRIADEGSVNPPKSILHKIQTGEYDFVYPGFE
ncbi:MAG: hypothetical protein DWQ47_01420 [Acidobacteria bacterium]|nr:MAG: hypothetical protein DWQ32_11880 [Acidobacteriota bacterium]REK04159.1 MAG: hypothetical protein DWQ38_01405 [Acidobacteriota bacterium]REK15321.1 MAG: hypothetical protein DWQ43_17570 [Acidobacteriota bacterium]REK46411.1 MAG: hypothetical protein DWQ47_01420 [Acidobacteriota bacterium]